MRIIEQLVYKIQGDNSEFDKSITQSETKVNKFGSVADKMLAGVTVAAIGMVIKKAIEMGNAFVDAASEAQETANKFGVTFSDIREEADATAKNLSDNFGLSSQKAQQLLSDTGDLLTGFGFTQESALDLSTQVNELAVDLASFTNYSGGAEGASVALTKALLGERESIKSLGIAITEADITQLAEDKGIVGELTRQQKAMLTLEIAISQSKNAIGDFARSSDEYANQSRILEGNLQDLRVEMGNKLLPIATQIKSAFVDLTGNILNNITASGNLKVSYDNLKTAVSNYNTILDESKGKTDAITQATIAQANAQMQLALQTASEAYSKSNKELDKYNTTIQKSEYWIERYDKILGDIAEGTGYTTEQLNIMTEQERLTAIALSKGVDEADRYNITVSARLGYQKDLVESNANLAQAQANQEGFVNLLTQGYVAENEAVGLLLDAYPELEQKVINNVEAYNKEQEAIKNRQKAIELAQKAFTAYDVENEQVLNGIIKMAKGHEDSAYWAELSRLATEKLNEVIIANGAETDKVNKILDNHEQGMESITNYAIALGDSYDANSEKASLLTSTIKALIDTGIDPESDAVAGLIAQLNSLTPATEEATEAQEDLGNSAVEAFKKSAQSRADAYKEIDSYRQSDYSKEMQAIREKAEAFLEAGVEEVDVAEWQSEQWDRIHEAQADKAEEEAKRARDAWVDYAFDVGGSIASMWSSINEVQSNAHESELQRMEQEGATEEELQEAKKQFAIEDLKRKKAQGTFQAIIDTASAVIGFLANPGGFAGVGLSAMAVGTGAAQIAAIQSEPLPSFDVGSIRIPETTQAVVHKDEMILTAPQAEQARREGITIAPTNATSGRIPIQNMIYLDGKQISEAVVQYLNSGSVGTIKARVVK